MDEIKLTGLKIFGHHGVLEEEKIKGQEFLVDITLATDIRKAGLSDDLKETVNYAEMAEYIFEIFDEEIFDLIEAVAEKIARHLLIKYPMVKDVAVTIHKPSAPISIAFSDVSVTAKRSRHTAFIAVGSNMGDSRAIIERAKEELFKDGDNDLIKEAGLIETKPYGVTNQPDFINGMWKIETLLTPFELLKRLNEIEAGEKRERIIHWGPRTLDLDIIYYDDCVIESERLMIPHIDMANRTFVLEPLKEIDPYKRHPVTGLNAGEMLKSIS